MKTVRRGECKKPAFTMEHRLEEYLIDHMEDLIAGYNASVQKLAKKAKSNEGKIEKIKGRLERLKDVYLDGDMKRAEYLEKTKELKAQLAELESLAAPALPVSQMPDNWREIYEQLSREGKRDFWHRVVRRIEIKGRAVHKVYFV